MLDLITKFPEQINEALAIGQKASLKKKKGAIQNIVVSGLGGSGIGGNLVSELVADELKVPMIANKSYDVPGFVNDKTLFILSSYSGNTEETVTVAKQVLKKGLSPYCVTSGGELLKIATKHKLSAIEIPAGFPPRACLGYSSIQLLFILHHNGLISNKFVNALKKTSAFLKAEQEDIKKQAQKLAKQLKDKQVIIYAEDKIESTALRLKQQLNENSKMYCWYHVIPEMNHNELVGWRESNDNWAVLWLRHDSEHKRNSFRATLNIELKKKFTECIYQIHAKGKTKFERHFYLVHFGDWLSYYLALERGYDPSEIDVLNELKSNLNKLK
jgi:glucose/mannose-6-phosphate isomerase